MILQSSKLTLTIFCANISIIMVRWNGLPSHHISRNILHWNKILKGFQEGLMAARIKGYLYAASLVGRKK